MPNLKHYQLHPAKLDILREMLEEGGEAVCTLHSPEKFIQAQFKVHLTQAQVHVEIDISGWRKKLTLNRGDSANHLHLSDYLEECANRPYSCGNALLAPNLSDALREVETVVPHGFKAYITATYSQTLPIGAVVADAAGGICAAATAATPRELANAIARKLRLTPEGRGEAA
jgi:hypothetical protein